MTRPQLYRLIANLPGVSLETLAQFKSKRNGRPHRPVKLYWPKTRIAADHLRSERAPIILFRQITAR